MRVTRTFPTTKSEECWPTRRDGLLNRVTRFTSKTSGAGAIVGKSLPCHSSRAGLATAAGVQERVIAQTTGHRSMTVLRWYVREGNLFTENAVSAVGLYNTVRGVER